MEVLAKWHIDDRATVEEFDLCYASAHERGEYAGAAGCGGAVSSPARIGDQEAYDHVQ